MDALLKIDRRWIFLLLLVSLISVVAVGDGMTFKIEPSVLVKGIHDKIESLPARAPVLVAIDFDPASRAEVDPSTRAALRQMFRKDLRVISMTHWPTGVDMARDIVDDTAAEFDDVEVASRGVFPSKREARARIKALNEAREEAAAATSTASVTPEAATATATVTARVNTGRRRGDAALPWRAELHDALRAAKAGALEIAGGAGADRRGFEVLEVVTRTATVEYGKDYCYLGTKAGEQVLVIAMGESIPTAFPTDPRTGRPTRELPVMEGVRALKDLAYLLTITSGSQADWWIVYGANKHRFPMGVACTAVVAPDLYPYYSAKQITGLAGGVKGAWEYEALIGTPGKATTYVPAQTVAHCVLIFLILVCNVAYFAGRRARS